MFPTDAELLQFTSMFQRLGFDIQAYFDNNPDLSVLGMDTVAVLAHLFAHGLDEKRRLFFKGAANCEAELARLEVRPQLAAKLQYALAAASFQVAEAGLIPPLHRLLKPRRDKTGNADLVVLVRTHIIDAKFYDLWNALNKADARFDVYALVDSTKGRQPVATDNVIWHEVNDCPGLGLHQRAASLFWLCGDIPLSIAYTSLPDYAYYVMLEADVHFRADAVHYVNRLVDVLTDARPPRVDGAFLAFHAMLHNEAGNWPFAAAALKVFPALYYGYFPFVVLSNRAIKQLLVGRQIEAARRVAPQDVVHCEAFVPSCLAEAGLACCDLNELISNSYDKDLMMLNHQSPERLSGLPLGFSDTFAADSEMIHSVYAQDDFLRRNLSLVQNDRDKLALYISKVEDGEFKFIPEDLRAPFIGAARQRLADLVSSAAMAD